VKIVSQSELSGRCQGAVKMSEALENSPSLIEAEATVGLDLIWGVKGIARTIRRSERAAFYLLENDRIPCARKIGGRWVASRAALCKFFEAA
jgi:hypothetical protein